MATSVAALAVWFLPRPLAIGLLAAAVAVALGVEWARRNTRWVRFHFLRRTRRMLRPGERTALAGATWLAIGYLLVALLLPGPVAVAAILYGALGDPAAALVGGAAGIGRTSWGKSWSGFAGGFGMDLAVGLAVPGIATGPAVFGALAASLLELLPLPLDDNFRTTVGGGVALYIATLVGPILA